MRAVEWHRRPRVHAIWFAIAVVCFALTVVARPSTFAETVDPGLPTRLEVEPNAIQDPSRPMEIEVAGLAPGESVRLQILRDCNGDGEPDLQGLAACQSPVLPERRSTPAGNDGVIHDRLDFQKLEAAGQVVPSETVLWLRASRDGSSKGRFVLFGLVKDPCTLWRSMIDLFLSGHCQTGLLQALREHLGDSSFGSTSFEVRRLDPSATLDAAAIPGTLGATGVAWLDSETLLITMAPVLVEDRSAGNRPPLQPGLWRVPLQTGEPSLLWTPVANDPRMPTAPLRLPGDRIAFVLQSRADGTETPPACLKVWKQGEEADVCIPLPYRIHQLLASDKEGHSILTLSLGAGENRPILLQIDLRTRSVTNMGFNRALYQAALRSPTGPDSVIALEDSSGQTGWNLILVNEQGKRKKRLQIHSLLPAWRPDGKEIAFLSGPAVSR